MKDVREAGCHWARCAFVLPVLWLAGCGGDSSDNAFSAINPISGLTYKGCNAAGSEEISYEFKSDLTGTYSVEPMTDGTCSTSNGAVSSTPFIYLVGGDVLAEDGLSATQLDLTRTGLPTAYKLIRLSGGPVGVNNLNFSSTAASSAGLDGSSPEKREDGIDLSVTYTLQP